MIDSKREEPAFSTYCIEVFFVGYQVVPDAKIQQTTSSQLVVTYILITTSHMVSVGAAPKINLARRNLAGSGIHNLESDPLHFVYHDRHSTTLQPVLRSSIHVLVQTAKNSAQIRKTTTQRNTSDDDLPRRCVQVHPFY